MAKSRGGGEGGGLENKKKVTKSAFHCISVVFKLFPYFLDALGKQKVKRGTNIVGSYR